MTAFPHDLDALARAVRKHSRGAVAFRAGQGRQAYLDHVAAILGWLMETEPGQALLARWGYNPIQPIVGLFDLYAAGIAQFVRIPMADDFSFTIVMKEPKE